jgi:uncharacterized cupin superfamily protein
MTDFVEVTAKGVSKFLVAQGVDPERLPIHVSEVGPGERPHPPHAHSGLEAIYILEGRGTLEVEGVAHGLGPNECMVLDTTRAHGLLNTGTTRMRYMVIITR